MNRTLLQVAGRRAVVPSSAFPDATNTGVPVGTSLTGSGSISSSSNGQTISEKLVTGTITVTHNDVIVEKNLVNNTGAYGILIQGARCICRDNEINANSAVAAGASNGIKIEGVDDQVLRNNIHHWENGIIFTGAVRALMQDNYVHNESTDDSDGVPHYDGIVSDGGDDLDNIIRHNTIALYHDDTSYINLADVFGTSVNTIIDNNKMIGGNMIFALTIDGRFNETVISCTVTGNIIEPGAAFSGYTFGSYALVLGTQTTCNRSGNFDLDGTPITG